MRAVEIGGKRITSGWSSGAVRGDEPVDALEGVFELAAAAVDAGHAGRDQQAVTQQLVAELAVDADRRFGRGTRQSSLCTSSIAALAESTRSLLIMSAALCASRRCRPTAYGES